MKRIYMIILMIKEIIIFEGPLEPMLTTYHYYVGCTNDLVNKDDKLTECAALQLGVEVPKYRQDPEYDKKMSRIKSNNKRVSISFYLFHDQAFPWSTGSICMRLPTLFIPSIPSLLSIAYFSLFRIHSVNTRVKSSS